MPKETGSDRLQPRGLERGSRLRFFIAIGAVVLAPIAPSLILAGAIEDTVSEPLDNLEQDGESAKESAAEVADSLAFLAELTPEQRQQFVELIEESPRLLEFINSLDLDGQAAQPEVVRPPLLNSGQTD